MKIYQIVSETLDIKQVGDVWRVFDTVKQDFASPLVFQSAGEAEQARDKMRANKPVAKSSGNPKTDTTAKPTSNKPKGPMGDPGGIKPSNYSKGKVTWFEFDKDGVGTRKTGSLNDYVKAENRIAKTHIPTKQRLAKIDAASKATALQRTKWFRRSYFGLAVLGAGAMVYDTWKTFNDLTSVKAEKLKTFVEMGIMDQQAYKAAMKDYRDTLLQTSDMLAENAIALVVGALTARMGTAIMLKKAVEVGRVAGRLPRFSLPTLIGWVIGYAGTALAAEMLKNYEMRIFYSVFKQWHDGDSEILQIPSNTGNSNIDDAKPLSQEELADIAEEFKDKKDQGVDATQSDYEKLLKGIGTDL